MGFWSFLVNKTFTVSKCPPEFCLGTAVISRPGVVGLPPLIRERSPPGMCRQIVGPPLVGYSRGTLGDSWTGCAPVLDFFNSSQNHLTKLAHVQISSSWWLSRVPQACADLLPGNFWRTNPLFLNVANQAQNETQKLPRNRTPPPPKATSGSWVSLHFKRGGWFGYLRRQTPKPECNGSFTTPPLKKKSPPTSKHPFG